MSNLENKKIARDCTISALFFTLAIVAFAITSGLFVDAMFVLGALLFCFLVLILSSVALRKWRLDTRDNISRKTKKYLTAIVVLLFITFVFLSIAMFFACFYNYYYYEYLLYRGNEMCVTMCFIFSFAAAALNIVEIVLFSIAISLEKKAIPQKLSAENATKSLQDYRYLYANGLITREEYDTQRERILSQLGL